MCENDESGNSEVGFCPLFCVDFTRLKTCNSVLKLRAELNFSFHFLSNVASEKSVKEEILKFHSARNSIRSSKGLNVSNSSRQITS